MNALKFKAWMAENRITQKELMELLDLSQTSINKKVNGREDFSLPQIRTICDKYGISADIFL
jgi:transcriptional regulator with XRE-family HTH domain